MNSKKSGVILEVSPNERGPSFINSRTAIAGAIIGLLLVFFLFRRHDFCYDHMTSQPLFVHSFMQFQLNCMCDVIFRS